MLSKQMYQTHAYGVRTHRIGRHQLQRRAVRGAAPTFILRGEVVGVGDKEQRNVQENRRNRA